MTLYQVLSLFGAGGLLGRRFSFAVRPDQGRSARRTGAPQGADDRRL